MAKRKRSILLNFYVSEEELKFIEKKMQEGGIRNRSAYLRKMAMDGYILHTDYSFLKKHTYQLSMIGNNINQIAHRLNATGTIYSNDLKEIKKLLEQVWRLQRSILLNLR